MKILVVDDSAMMRKLIARALVSPSGGTAGGGPPAGAARPPGGGKGDEVEVVEASDGMEALAMIHKHGTSIELILCDMNMPNVNGLSLLRSLRGSPELKTIPFIIVTADESDASTEQALREGAAGVIGKPFQPEVIAALIKKKRSHGRRATSATYKSEVITSMVRSISRSARASRDRGAKNGDPPPRRVASEFTVEPDATRAGGEKDERQA